MLDNFLLQNLNEVNSLTLLLSAKANGRLGSLAQVLVTSEHPDALALHIKATKDKIIYNFKLQYYSCDGDISNPLVIAFLLAQIEATFSSELQYEFALNSEDIRNVLTSFYLPEDRIEEVCEIYSSVLYTIKECTTHEERVSRISENTAFAKYF